MDETVPDRKPGRILALYILLALGVLSGAGTEIYGGKMTWTQVLMGKAAASVAFFVFWWIALMVCFHGYHFVRALFHHPN